jgi:hypothetical protein
MVINVKNYSQRYAVNPEAQWGNHPELEAAIECVQLPESLSLIEKQLLQR